MGLDRSNVNASWRVPPLGPWEPGIPSNRYEIHGPGKNLLLDCYVHELMDFRYHWHADDFELSILLNGEQVFCRGEEIFHLSAGDVILVDSNTGHASYCLDQGIYALILHFSASTFHQLTEKGTTFSFASCCSDEVARDERKYCLVRRYAAQVYTTLASGGPYANYRAKACAEMLIATLLEEFPPKVVPALPDTDPDTQQVMRRIMEYIGRNYAERISLEEIADFSQYTRTYVSALFKKTMGVNFHEYLMRIRFRHALYDLTQTEKSLTEVALSNGFSELKAFNKCFRETLHCLPSEYRAQVRSHLALDSTGRKFASFSDSLIRSELLRYIEQ